MLQRLFPGGSRKRLARNVLMGVVVVAVLAGLLVAGVLFFQPLAAVRLLAKANPDVLFLVDTNRKAVALTIDDAPSREVTPGILERLRRYDAHATFFVIGDQVQGNEDLIRQILADGNELGNHMMHDRPSILLSREDFAGSLAHTDSLLGDTDRPRWFRPASGWFNRNMLQAISGQGDRCCLGSIFPHDNKLRRPHWIARFIMSRVFPGAIIILHDGGPRRLYTLEVLDLILPRLKAEGYQVMTVSELVATANE